MDRSSDRDNRTSQRSRDDRDRDHKHRSSRDEDDKHHESDSHRHHHRSDRESHRDSHKSSSSSRRDDRERSRERERSHDSGEDRKGSRDRREHKPKRERSYDEGEVQEYEMERKKKRERRRFGDKVTKEEPDEEEGQIVGNNDVRVDEGEVKGKEEVDALAAHDGSHGAWTSNGRVSSWNNGAALESVKTSSIPPDTSIPRVDLPTKVSSISNTNENKGVSITRSHEVHGKSSTDGTSSAAEKAGNLSLDAIAKTKLMLQRHKEMSERIKKKIPQMAKNNSSTSDGKTSSSTGLVQGSLLSTTVSAGAMSSTFTAADSVKPPAYGVTSISGVSATDYEAIKRAQELAAKMGFRQDPQFATLLQAQAEIFGPQKPTKAPVLRVDALGREIDEHGNVINVTKPSNLSTLKVCLFVLVNNVQYFTLLLPLSWAKCNGPDIIIYANGLVSY